MGYSCMANLINVKSEQKNGDIEEPILLDRTI
jgi:hypothetical protein